MPLPPAPPRIGLPHPPSHPPVPSSSATSAFPPPSSASTTPHGNGGGVHAADAAGKSVTLSTRRGTFHARLYGFVEESSVKEASGLPPAPLIVALHGAGMSSLGFGLCAAIVAASTQVDGHPYRVQMAALDFRCHGASTFEQGEAALTMDTLVEDTAVAIRALLETYYTTTTPSASSSSPPQQAVYLVGHSLGGSVATFVSSHRLIASHIAGVVMLDIAESVAKGSLRHMRDLLDKRPSSFHTPNEAAHWFVNHGGMGNLHAASITVPSLLKQAPPSSSSSSGTDVTGYVWNTNLYATEPCWDTWFEGLDKTFIQLPCPKMLILANTDRLDKELLVGQMQGKFQLEVVGSPGHYVMEDAPEIVASKLLRFVHRIDTLRAKLPQFTAHTLSLGKGTA